jgi:hypothetical protein
MFGKNRIGLLFLSFFIGCAEPKYVISNEEGPNKPGLQESKSNCQISFSNSGLCLTWYWETKPTSTKPGSLIFKTYRLNLLDQTPIEVDLESTPQVVLWMPSMGHGSTPTQTARVDRGTYRATNVFFIMPGDWEIRFQVKNGATVIDETTISLVF